MSENALGKPVPYPSAYAPEVLFPIARSKSRRRLGLTAPLPFTGFDVWNAWELGWLAESGCPEVADLELRVPADSPYLVESKSLKLYLNSFAMSRFASPDSVAAIIRTDLEALTGAAVQVSLRRPAEPPLPVLERLPGHCIDAADVVCSAYDVDASVLMAEPADHAAESLHTHLLRSLCPVTGQPDSGSVLVTYRGPRIDSASLLRYVVSFRQHQDFHEACVERMFADISARCRPQSLTVYARYQRRGGIDINPYRSTEPGTPPNLRLWRQ
jgi:7-cyano-7-deazaguanine reductase